VRRFSTGKPFISAKLRARRTDQEDVVGVSITTFATRLDS
jgi:hypothetical protein